MSAATGSSEDEKTLMELQDRLLTGTQALSRFAQQERAILSRKQRTELTLAELASMPDDTRTYKSVGKAYFLSPKTEVVSGAQDFVNTCTEDVEKLRNQRTVIEGKMKETENELRELIKSHPQLVRQLGNLQMRP